MIRNDLKFYFGIKMSSAERSIVDERQKLHLPAGMRISI